MSETKHTPEPTMARLLWIAEQLATEAKMATNALAITARAQYQHAEVARLHIAIDLLKDELVGYQGKPDPAASLTALVSALKMVVAHRKAVAVHMCAGYRCSECDWGVTENIEGALQLLEGHQP